MAQFWYERQLLKRLAGAKGVEDLTWFERLVCLRLRVGLIGCSLIWNKCYLAFGSCRRPRYEDTRLAGCTNYLGRKLARNALKRSDQSQEGPTFSDDCVM
jgi:hypothetical protein